MIILVLSIVYEYYYCGRCKDVKMTMLLFFIAFVIVFMVVQLLIGLLDVVSPPS